MPPEYYVGPSGRQQFVVVEVRRPRFAALLAGACLLLSGLPVAAQSPVAASIDWRPRADLPPEQQARLPPFCRGGYLSPRADATAAVPGEGSPVNASALSARYEMETRLLLEGDVRLSQAGTAITGDRAVYDQASGQVDITGPMTSRSPGLLLTGEQAIYDANSGFFRPGLLYQPTARSGNPHQPGLSDHLRPGS